MAHTDSAFPLDELDAILSQAIAVARGAGEILREGVAHIRRREHVAINYKTNEFDPVTEYDHRSEAFIVEGLQRTFPTHRIVGEEGGEYRRPNDEGQASNTFEWQIDPLDGTVNFAHGFPIFSVSLGLLVNGEPALGVVYNPMSEEMYAAIRGRGATLNGESIRVSPVPTLSRSLLNTGFPYDLRTSEQNNLQHFIAFQRRSQEVRRVGSAALDLCWVACGRMEGYWEAKIKPHDIAAGIVIVREAGGMVTDYDGGDGMLACGQCVASNGLIHVEMLDVLRGE
jgi:myo-inositol-1(or 4)-monophosphatase